MTPGYVTLSYAEGMARDRSDRRWSAAETLGERLRWARESDGRWLKAAPFAREMKIEEHTYRAYEGGAGRSKTIRPPYEVVAALAAKLMVEKDWLYGGDGTPWLDESTPMQRARELLEGRPQAEQERAIQILELALKTGTDG